MFVLARMSLNYYELLVHYELDYYGLLVAKLRFAMACMYLCAIEKEIKIKNCLCEIPYRCD